ncbi:hypothetical protein IWZ01DRAFT_232884 [Phyllosticta capitalensis]
MAARSTHLKTKRRFLDAGVFQDFQDFQQASQGQTSSSSSVEDQPRCTPHSQNAKQEEQPPVQPAHALRLSAFLSAQHGCDARHAAATFVAQKNFGLTPAAKLGPNIQPTSLRNIGTANRLPHRISLGCAGEAQESVRLSAGPFIRPMHGAPSVVGSDGASRGIPGPDASTRCGLIRTGDLSLAVSLAHRLLHPLSRPDKFQ